MSMKEKKKERRTSKEKGKEDDSRYFRRVVVRNEEIEPRGKEYSCYDGECEQEEEGSIQKVLQQEMQTPDSPTQTPNSPAAVCPAFKNAVDQ